MYGNSEVGYDACRTDESDGTRHCYVIVGGEDEYLPYSEAIAQCPHYSKMASIDSEPERLFLTEYALEGANHRPWCHFTIVFVLIGILDPLCIIEQCLGLQLDKAFVENPDDLDNSWSLGTQDVAEVEVTDRGPVVCEFQGSSLA